VNVIKILEHEAGDAVERELMLVKVKAEGESRARILEICDVFRVRVLDVTHRTITIEGTGTPDKLEALLELLRDFGIVELSRTGRIALARGDRGIKERSARLRSVAGAEQEYTGGASEAPGGPTTSARRKAERTDGDDLSRCGRGSVGPCGSADRRPGVR
jgi:acetolactate synthase, small subunit